MRKICIQSGHWNTTNGQTGAPRELERTLAIGKRLVELLSLLPNVEAYRDDALPENDPKVLNTDWDLYLSLHCDANYAGDEGGGFVDFIDPSIDSSPESNKESARIAKAIEEVYFPESGIRNVPSRRNANTKFYYMWDVLSANTHCVIIEMGESIDPHDNVILNDTERQAQVLLRAIQNAFPDMKPVPTPVPVTDYKELYEQQKQETERVKQQCQLDVKTINDQKDSISLQLNECRNQRDIYKAEYDKVFAPEGYKAQITHLEEYKKNVAIELTEAQRKASYWQTKYNAIKKSGLKFIQHAVILLCEKAGIDLTQI